jgi:hypothetical protein
MACQLNELRNFSLAACEGVAALDSYLSLFCFFALTASANSIRRRIASERVGLSFCRLAQLSMCDFSEGGSRTAITGSRPVAGRPTFFGITFLVDRLAMFWYYQNSCEPMGSWRFPPALTQATEEPHGPG